MNRVYGSLLLLTGLLFTVDAWLGACPGGPIIESLPEFVIVFTAGVLLIGAGAFLITRGNLHLPDLGRVYRFTATVLLSSFLLLVLINGACWLLLESLEREEKISIPGFTQPDGLRIRYQEVPVIGLLQYVRTRRVQEDATRSLAARPGWADALHDFEALRMNNEEPEMFFFEPLTSPRINIHPAGFRAKPPAPPWPPRQERINIFVFGGSTTFGWGVADDQTIPNYLRAALKKGTGKTSLQVYNFALPSFHAMRERLLFERLLASGHIPSLAIFIDGVNEFLHYDDRAGLYQTPAAYTAWRERQRRLKAQGRLQRPYPKNDQKLIQSVIKRYVTCKHMIEGLGKAFDVPTLFVWHPVPDYKYKRDANFSESMRADTRHGYPAMAGRLELNGLGKNFLWLADVQENRNDELYIDRIHFTPAFNQELAEHIARFVMSSRTLDRTSTAIFE